MKRFERRHESLLPWRSFLGRQALYLLLAAALLGLSLFLGMAGFRYLEGLSWLDSLLNATMLLGGEGPLTPPQSPAGKLFASFYAIYSGVVFLLSFGLLISPLLHRFYHHFHLAEEDLRGAPPKRRRR